jgi:hypothetical protein
MFPNPIAAITMEGNGSTLYPLSFSTASGYLLDADFYVNLKYLSLWMKILPYVSPEL